MSLALTINGDPGQDRAPIGDVADHDRSSITKSFSPDPMHARLLITTHVGLVVRSISILRHSSGSFSRKRSHCDHKRSSVSGSLIKQETHSVFHEKTIG